MTTIDQYRPPRPASALIGPQYDARAPQAAPVEANEPGFGDTLLRLHALMRGRYLLTSLLAILLGAGLGLLGYRTGEQTYRSVGQIRIVPTLPRIMYETEDKGVMPMFDSFVQTQVSLIKTQRVVEIALEDRAWPTPPPRDGRSQNDFASRLNVIRDNELIAITFDDRDPTFAQVAVKTVIAAYRKLYIEADGRENETVLNQLTQRQSGLSSELAINRKSIRQIADRYNTEQIDGFFTTAQAQVQQLELDVATARSKQLSSEEMANTADQIDPESLAATDAILSQLLAQKAAKKLDLDVLEGSYGPQSRAVIEAHLGLNAANKSIEERVQALTRRSVVGPSTAPSKWQVQVSRLTAQLAAEQQRVKAIGQDQFQLADLKREAADLSERLNQTKTRIEELNTEAPVATGRVSVISDGDWPLVPARDTRKTFAGLGAVAGVLIPFGFALLLAGANRKFGTPVETRMSAITRDLVLGALPAIDEAVFDPESSTLAAHCLHQIRAMLQVRCHGHSKAIVITSSRAQSGKTSVVLGLGVSFAMAGSRTLLIDLDLVGGGLTRRAEIQSRARLGRLLLEQGLVNDEQLQAALELAKEKQIKLGEAFVEAGYLRPEQLDGILQSQRRNHAGLMDALYGKTLAECVSNAGMDHLDILPLGSANPHDAATLSPGEIKSLIDEAKSMYDTILIDTGPVPGSLEASMVASLVDGVLIVVARGEPRAGAETSLEHLRRVGGHVLGIVFNRAKPSDAGTISGSIYGGTSLRATPGRQPTPAARQAASTRFGPVGQAVLDLSPTNLT